MKKKITHHPDLCIGCGGCVSLCPKLFKINENSGLAELIDGQKEGDKVILKNVAIQNCLDLDMVCPQGAIEVEDQEKN